MAETTTHRCVGREHGAFDDALRRDGTCANEVELGQVGMVVLQDGRDAKAPHTIQLNRETHGRSASQRVDSPS